MNDNDIADQLRLVYQIMRFQRNNKWWWALFLWGCEVSLVNSYVSMKRYCDLKGVPVPWTHHDWNEAISRYAHLDPIEYWPRRKGPFKNDDTTCPTKQDNPSDLKKKAPRVDSMVFSPTWGRLKGRLNHNTTIHMLVPPSSQNATCQLHCWAYKEMHPLDKAEGSNIKPSGSHSHVMRCEACGVHLCLKCWELFYSKQCLKSHVFDILMTRMVSYEFAMPFDGIRACNDVFNGGYYYYLARIYHVEISRNGIAQALIGRFSKMR